MLKINQIILFVIMWLFIGAGITYFTRFTSENTAEIQDKNVYPEYCEQDEKMFADECLRPLGDDTYGYPLTYKVVGYEYGQKTYDEQTGKVDGVMVDTIENTFLPVNFAINSAIWAVVSFGLVYGYYLLVVTLISRTKKSKK